MSAALSRSSRLRTAALWPIGIALTSWHYMWRTTPMHRSEAAGSAEEAPPALPVGVSRDDLQRLQDGVGPIFHRRYTASIRDATASPEELLGRIKADPNCASPTEFARFHKVRGTHGTLRAGDEFIVRMPGPWDGPVRVVDVGAESFLLATLAGHLEAGQIEFRASSDDKELRFSIESWARSGDRLSNLLYSHLRMAKEVQLHMWTSFLEEVARLAGGRLRGGIEIATRRIEDVDGVS